jgi:2-iminoacetate synthase ThiH
MPEKYVDQFGRRILRKYGMQDESAKPPMEPTALQLGEDYYYDGPYVVFTAQYHLKRGTCCNSGCRHCPYQSSPATEAGSD